MFSKLKKIGTDIGESLTHSGSAHRNQAKAYLQSGDYASALREITSAIKHEPHNEELYALRGECHMGLNQYEEAVSDYSQAIEFGRKSPLKGHYYKARGTCYRHTKDYDKALDDYNQAISLVGDALELQRLKQEVSESLEKEKAKLAEQQAAAEAERQKQAREREERAKLEAAQRQALEAARQRELEEAERQRIAAEEAARLEANLQKYARIRNWLPDDVAELFGALSSDYVQEIIGCRSHLVIEDEQRICSQVKLIRQKEEVTVKQAEVARLEAERAVETARVELENRQWLATRVFGAEKWNKYFGDVGLEPPLPPNMREILSGACPIWAGKTVEETHMLVLVPQSVNGTPLTLTRLGEWIQTPRQGHATKYDPYEDRTRQVHGDAICRRSHWVLMTKDVIPGSRDKSYAEQKDLVGRLGGVYQVPSVLDVAVCILMEHVEKGVRLFGDKPWTFTRCLEQVEGQWPVVVGGFSPVGLHVFIRNIGLNGLGVAALRMF